MGLPDVVWITLDGHFREEKPIPKHRDSHETFYLFGCFYVRLVKYTYIIRTFEIV